MRNPRSPLAISVLVLALASCSDDPSAPAETNTPPGFVRLLGGTGADGAWDVVVTSAGLRVVVGSFQDRFNVTGTTEKLDALGGTDAFISAFNPDGTLAWQHALGGLLFEEIFTVARNAADEFLVGGVYIGDTSIGATNLQQFGNSDIFVAKLDASGNPEWVLGAGSPEYDFPTDVASARDGSFYVCGGAGGEFNIAGEDVGTFVAASGFLLRLVQESGGGNWVQLAIAPGRTTCEAVACASDATVFVCGDFVGELEVSGVVLEPDGGGDSFVARYADDSSDLGAFKIGGPGSTAAREMILVDDAPVVVGDFGGTADFDVNSSGGQATSLGLGDIFVARYQANGSLAWLRTFGSASFETANDIARLPNGNFLVVGTFDSPLLMFGSHSVKAETGADAFLVQLGPSGDVVAASQINDEGSTPGVAVAASNTNGIVVGFGSGDIVFPGGQVIRSFGSVDGYILQRK